MAKTVTYKGPEDPADISGAYEIEGHLLPLDVPVSDVPDNLAAQLKETEGHAFEISGTDKKEK